MIWRMTFRLREKPPKINLERPVTIMTLIKFLTIENKKGTLSKGQVKT